MLPLVYDGLSPKNRMERAKEALEIVGLSDRMHHHPNQLSGGQQQRVAMPGRLLINRPFCWLMNQRAIWIARPVQKSSPFSKNCIVKRHQTVVYVTHDSFTARHTERIIHLADGQVKSEEIVAQPLIAGVAHRESADEPVTNTTATNKEAVR